VATNPGNASPSPFSIGEDFFAVRHSMIACPAYRDLDVVARALLADMMAFVKQPSHENNGHVGLSVRQAAVAVSVSPTIAARALDSLASHGFIIRTWNGRRISGGQKIASKWELTMFRRWQEGSTDMQAGTFDYLKWQAPKPAKPVPIVQPEGVKTLEAVGYSPARRKSRAKAQAPHTTVLSAFTMDEAMKAEVAEMREKAQRRGIGNYDTDCDPDTDVATLNGVNSYADADDDIPF
jgi:hypothetical protein